MKKSTLAILLSLSAFAWAGTNSNPAEYTISVHVTTSRMVIEGSASAHQQRLNVVIDGKKYELESEIYPNALLKLGDYKAKVVKDEHRSTYDSYQVYEFLFLDNKTRRFMVVGQTE